MKSENNLEEKIQNEEEKDIKSEEEDKKDEELLKKYKIELDQKKKVIELMNKMGNLIIGEKYYSDLIIEEDEVIIISNLFKAQLEFINSFLKDKESISKQNIYLTLFKTFFIKDENFNLNDFENKKNYFEKFLLYYNIDNSKNLDESLGELIFAITKEDKNLENFALEFINDKGLYTLYFVLLFKFSSSKEIFVQHFFDYKKSMSENKDNVVIEKNYTSIELSSIANNNLIKDLTLSSLPYNYLHLRIKGGHLALEEFKNEEISKLINDSNTKKKKKKRKKKKKEDKKEENEEDKKEENEEDKKEENEEDKKEENEENKKEEKKEDKKEENEEEILNSTDKNIKKDKYGGTIEDDENKKDELEDEYEELEGEEDDKERIELLNELSTTKAKIRDLEIQIISLEKKCNFLESKLKLIQLRDSLKCFIDCFYHSLIKETKKVYKYESKLKIVKKQIKGNNNMLYDFLDLLLIQISFSNIDAHELNLKQSIVDQIFQYIDPNNKFEKIKNLINKEEVDNYLRELLYLKKKYFYDNKELNSEINKALKDINITDILKNKSLVDP